LQRTFKFSGIIVNENNSRTGCPVSTGVTVKFRTSMAIAILISSIAKLRPGQKRGPAPKGVKALRLWGQLGGFASSQRSGLN